MKSLIVKGYVDLLKDEIDIDKLVSNAFDFAFNKDS